MTKEGSVLVRREKGWYVLSFEGHHEWICDGVDQTVLGLLYSCKFQMSLYSNVH